MKTRQGQTVKTTEVSQQNGLNGGRKQSQQDGAVTGEAQDYQQQLNQLRQWVTAANAGDALPLEAEGTVENLTFLQTLVEGSPDAIFVKDTRGHYLFVNATFSHWTQKTPAQLLGRTDRELFSPAIAAQLAQADTQVLEQGKSLTEEIAFEDLALGGAGERNLVLTKIPFRNREKRIIGLLGVARDNTLRKLMEEELRESKQFNEQIIASAREGIVVYDADLRYILWNSFMEEFFGIPSHKVIGRHPAEVFPTFRELGMLGLLERALVGETVTSPDFQVTSKNAWATCHFGPLRDLRGEIIGVIATITDITERKKIEAALRRSQQFNQQVIASASEGILVCDRELRCMVWNPTLEELSGLSGEAALGRSILDLLPHWRADGLRQMLLQALQGDIVESPDFELDRHRQIWVSAKYSPLRDSDDKAIGVIGVLADTTARRQAEEALRESQQFNAQVIDNALEGIAVYDRDLRVVVWNPFMEELLEVHKAQVLGNHVLEVFPHLRATESPLAWQRALAGETVQGREFQLLGGKGKWVTASYGPLRNQRGEVVGVIVSMRDITERKEAEDALRASQRFNQQVIDNAREGVIVYDRDLTYLVWNPAMEAFSGIPASDVLGKRAPEIFPTLAGSELYQRLQQVLTGVTLKRYDYLSKFETSRKQGYFSRQDAPLRDERGALVGIISIISDISERKRTEEALRESQQFNQEIIANAREGIVVYDRELKVRVWNRAMEAFSGKRSAEVLDQHLLEIFPQFRGTDVPERVTAALQGEAQESGDFQLGTGPDGKPRWFAARYGPHRNSKGAIVGVIATIRDITARKQATDDLRQSEERYRQILATIQDGYFEVSLKGELNFYNDALGQICNCKRKELDGTRYRRFLSTSTKRLLHKVFLHVRRTGEPIKAFEFRFHGHDGQARALETSITLMRDEAGQPCGYRGVVRDVTERKEAEQRIKERDERFRGMIENTYDGIVVLSPEGKLLYASPSYERIHGFRPVEVEGQSVTERFHPDDLPQVQNLGANLPPGASATIRYRMRNKAGEYLWLEGTVTNLTEEPSVRGFIVNFRDISERLRMEEERAQAEARLRASESRFRALIENSYDGIALQDAAGRMTYVSPAYTRILGYQAEEVLGERPADRLHPDDLEAARQQREAVLAEPGARRTLRFRSRHKDGSWRWLEVTLTNLLADPAVGSMVVNFCDISERHQSEHALRTSEQKFRAIWDNTLDAMLLVNDEMHYVDANPAACALYGVTREELLARSMADFVTPEKRDSARISLQKLVKRGARKGHFQMTKPDHTLREIEYSARANILPGLHLSVMRDVTERNRAEEALRTSEERYRSLVSVLEEGILMLDHEGELLTCNESAERILGLSRNELRERGLINPLWQAIREDGTPFPPDEAPSRVTLRTGQPCSGVLMGVTRPAGELCWLSVSSQPIYQPDAEQPHAVVISLTDISERKKTEEALHESQNRFSVAFNASPIALAITEPDAGLCVSVNRTWARLFGYEVNEVIGHNILELGVWQDPAARAEMVRHVKARGKVRDFEAQMRTRKGQTLDVLISAVRIELNNQTYMLTSSQDVTERKRAELALRESEAALRESEARFSTAFALNPLAVVIVEKQTGRIANPNRAWCEMFGYRAEEAIGHTALELGIWPQPAARAQMHGQLSAHGSLRDYEVVLQTRTGELKNIVLAAEQITLGNQEYFLVLNQDVTARKHAELALRESEERFSTAFNASPQPMIMIDLETRCFINVNEAWLQTFGFSAAEVIGHTGAELNLWEDPAERERIYQVVATGQTVKNLNAVLRDKAGEPRHCIISSDLIESGGKRYLLSVTNDITERRLAEEALRHSEALFASIFNTCPEPMALNRLADGHYVRVNRACLRTLGLDEKDILGRTPEEIELWADAAQSKRFYEALLVRGEVRDFECAIYLKGGHIGYFLISAEIIELDGVAHVLSLATAITERKRAEGALRASEERFARAFQSSPQPIAILSLPEGRFVTINAAATKTLGYTMEEAAGRTAAELNLRLDERQYKRLQARLAKRRPIRDFELTLCTKQGATRHLILAGEIIQLAGADYLLINALDNTERKLAEAAQRVSEERFSKAFNSSPLLMAISDLAGRIELVNESLTKTLGYTAEEVIGKTPEEIGCWPDTTSKEQITQELQASGSVKNFEIILRTKSGELRDYLYCCEVIELVGQPRILCSAFDITDRKLAEAALRDSETRYRLLFERNLAGVSRVTLDGVILDCNEAYATMFGFDSPADIKASTLHCLYPDPAVRAQLIADLRARGSLTNYEVRLQRKDGSEIWVLANLTLHEGEGQPLPVIEDVMLDITKRKQDEATLSQARDQLRALSARLSAIREEERSAIAREIHDSLGQMLTGMKLDIAWLHKRLAAAKEETQLALAEKTAGIANLLDDTIQTVRDLATQLRPGVLDTLGLTAAIEWQVQDFQHRTGIQCEVWLCPEPKELPKERSTGLFRILQELLTNIIRHASATRVVIHLLPTETGLLLSVADNGRGITTGDLTDPKSLGLLGMRERAHMIGGEMKFEGDPDRGTTVTITVPLAR